MKTSLWVLVTLLTGIVGLLVGFSASSKLSVKVAGSGHAAGGTSGYAAPAPAGGYGPGSHAAGGAAGYGGVGAQAGGASGSGGEKPAGAKAQEAAVKTSGY